jgi:hypothetical protein
MATAMWYRSWFSTVRIPFWARRTAATENLDVFGDENMVVRIPDNITVVIEIIFDSMVGRPGPTSLGMSRITVLDHYVIRKLEAQASVSSFSASQHDLVDPTSADDLF